MKRLSGIQLLIGVFMMSQTNLIAASPYGVLSPAEKNIIVNKGTERPYSGRYDKHFASGLYCCRNCGTPLYSSDGKFDSGCGWPAFDQELPGRIKRTVEPDGRVEISCEKCKAHLGHVFTGEKLTPSNIRHCVNSTSLVFEGQEDGKYQRAVFAGGCFWGVEELMRSQKGVIAAISGYTGGQKQTPTYREICSGRTGHAEAVEVIYDPRQNSFENLCRYFLEIHDPTQKDRQGPDIGGQYRSAIFYLDEKQRRTSENLLNILRKKGYDIQTELVAFNRFWPAEPEHQRYYERTGKAPYCHRYQKRF